MQKAPIPADEKERLDAVHRAAILDTAPEERFDKLTKEAVEKLHVPISTVSILDSDREWFKSCVGTDQKEGDRSISFCGHALLAKDIFIVEDTFKDERFANNPTRPVFRKRLPDTPSASPAVFSFHNSLLCARMNSNYNTNKYGQGCSRRRNRRSKNRKNRFHSQETQRLFH
jgi:hypothetical protein